jgi:hypothetical protein
MRAATCVQTTSMSGAKTGGGGIGSARISASSAPLRHRPVDRRNHARGRPRKALDAGASRGLVILAARLPISSASFTNGRKSVHFSPDSQAIAVSGAAYSGHVVGYERRKSPAEDGQLIGADGPPPLCWLAC